MTSKEGTSRSAFKSRHPHLIIYAIKMIFNHYTQDQSNKHTKQIIKLCEAGHSKDRIKEEINLKDFDELYSIAKARIKNRNEKYKKTSYKNLFFNETDLRFATNESVAEYRAKRLMCKTIIEIGAGIGLQSIEFAKTCKKVIAIEIDKRKHEYAKANAEIFGIKNIDFVNEDALIALESIKEADIIFWEPERIAEEKTRTLESVKPAINQLLEKAQKITENICIELPPQIELNKIKFDCEKEYISIEGELRRIHVYFGKLKKANYSAVSLTKHARIEGDAQVEIKLKINVALDYVYEADAAVVKAGLVNEAVKDSKELYLLNDKKNVFLTSKELIKNSFFAETYNVLGKCGNKEEEIINLLQKQDCKQVILRMNIAPDKYWQERTKYESKLNGTKKLYLFSFGKEALICEKI